MSSLCIYVIISKKPCFKLTSCRKLTSGFKITPVSLSHCHIFWGFTTFLRFFFPSTGNHFNTTQGDNARTWTAAVMWPSVVKRNEQKTQIKFEIFPAEWVSEELRASIFFPAVSKINQCTWRPAACFFARTKRTVPEFWYFFFFFPFFFGFSTCLNKQTKEKLK